MTPSQFKAIRRSLKFSQAKMAKHLGGYSVRAIQSWEQGINGIPLAVQSKLKRRLKAITDVS